MKKINDEEPKPIMIELLTQIANGKYDGHFTLMKFATGWKCCFGTIDSREDIEHMAQGETMEEAIKQAILNQTCAYNFKQTK